MRVHKTVFVGFNPDCPHCPFYIHDMLLHFRHEFVPFFFVPQRAAPDYHHFEGDALEGLIAIAPMVAHSKHTPYVPNIHVGGSFIQPYSDVRAPMLYSYHPVVHSPENRRIFRRDPFFPIDVWEEKERVSFITTVIGKKVEEAKLSPAAGSR